MDTRKIEKFMNNFGLHILMVIAGLVLLINPDGATALVTKLIGWILVVLGAVMLIRPTLRKERITTGNWIMYGLGIAVGVLLLAKPMLLADGVGRFFGILLVMEGSRNFRLSGARLTTVLTIAAGVVLVIMPRTLTHTVLAVSGIVMIVIGVVNILGKVNRMKRLEEPGDPNIIDADQ